MTTTITWNSGDTLPEVTRGSGKNFLVAVSYPGPQTSVNEAWYLNKCPIQVPVCGEDFTVAGVDTVYLTGWHWVTKFEECNDEFTKIEQPVVAWCAMPEPPL